MRMHWFKTPSEANQACFVPRSLATLGIKPVEVSESSLSSPVRNWAQWQGSTASHNQVLPFRGEAGSDCVSCLWQWLPRLLRWEGTVRHLPVLLQSISEGLLLFDPVFQLWRSTDSQMLGYTCTLTLSSSSGYSTSWLELHAGITSHRTQELVSA